MDDGIQVARQRLLKTVRGGDWERVPDQADAFAAAVRADERRRVLDQAIEALKAIFEDDRIEDESLDQIGRRCLAALNQLL